MRVSRLRVQNLRCLSELELDLSADVVAIFGRNGTGKTAVFDALEFALFGSVARLEHEQTALRSIYTTSDTIVEVSFSDAANSSITARMGDKVSLTGSGGWKSHNDLLYDFLIDSEQFAPRRERQPIHDLYRATMMLSQSSIRDFIDGDSAERGRIFAQLAGAAYYQRCLEKATAVVAEAEKRRKQASIAMQALGNEGQEVRSNLASLESRLSVWEEDFPGLVGNTEAAWVQLSLRAHQAGLGPLQPPTDGTLDELDVGWGAVDARLDEQMSGVAEELHLVNELQHLLKSHKESVRRADALARRVTETRNGLEDASKAVQAAEQEVSRLDANAMSLRDKMERAGSKLRSIGRLDEARDRLSSLKGALEDQLAGAPELERNVADREHRESAARRQRHLLTQERAATTSRLEEVRTEAAALEALLVQLPEHRKSLEVLGRIRSATQELVERRNERAQQLGRLEQELATASEGLLASEATLKRLQGGDDSRLPLVARLSALADGQSCPACGHDHGSPEALKGAFQDCLQAVSQDAEAELIRQSELRQRIAGLEDQRSEAKGLISESHDHESSLVADIQRLEQDAAALTARASAMGVEPSEDFVEKERTGASSRESELAKQLKSLGGQIEESVQSYSQSDADLQEASLALSATRDSLLRLEDRIAEQANEIEELSSSIVSPDQTSDRTPVAADLERDLKKVRAELDEGLKQRSSAESDLEAARQQVKDRRVALEDAETERAEQLARIDDFQARVRRADLVGEPTEEALAERTAELTVRSGDVAEIRRRARQLFTAQRLEAANTRLARLRAETATLDQSMRGQQAQVTKLRRAGTQAELWVSQLESTVVEGVERTVAAHRLEIERHFKTMIPMPHLFESLVMRLGSKNDVELGVQYRDQVREAGEPRYYLSHGQANVLALSVFLSMASKQRWSRLSTILLDDPVQDLDDLDAVSFLDTLRAVALGRFGPRRQIVVSTCDQRLYLLMCRKLQGLESVGLRFSGISLHGGGLAGPRAVVDFGEASAA